jgi:serine protease
MMSSRETPGSAGTGTTKVNVNKPGTWMRAAALLLGLLCGTAPHAAEEYNPFAGRSIAQAPADRLIIGLSPRPATAVAKPGNVASSAKVAELARRSGVGLRHLRELAPDMAVVQLEQPAGESLAAVLDRLRADPEVRFAEPDARMHPHRVPSDPGFFEQWFLQPPGPTLNGTTASAIDAVDAWDVTLGAPEVAVAVIDTGVRFDHPDLGRAESGGKLLPGYDFVSAESGSNARAANDGDGWDPDPSDPGDWISTSDLQFSQFAGCAVEDSSWHGTRVSGIVAALTDNATGVAGVAWNVRVLPVRVLGKCGGLTSDVIAGMRWAAGLTQSGAPANPTPAKILNVSLGGQGACSSAYQSAIDEITARGTLVVVSAGNDGAQVDQPGNCRGVASVTGIRHVGTKVGFANLGSDVTIAAPGGNCVNVGPGEACLFSLDTTTNLGLTTPAESAYTDRILDFNVGTSFAAPIVSGVAALMASVNGNLSPARIVQRLQQTALSFPVSGDPSVPTCRDPSQSAAPQLAECNCTTQTCGAGMVSAPGAVAAALRPIASISAPPTVSAGITVTITGSPSRAADGRTIASYEWAVLSGSVSLSANSGEQTSFTSPAGGGTVIVRLTVTDDLGRVDTADATVRADVSPSLPRPSIGGGGGGGRVDALWLLLVITLLLVSRRRGNRPG